MMVKEVSTRLLEHEVTIDLTDAAKEWLAQEGFDQVFGARPLRRAVQRHIETPLSKRMLAGELAPGDHIVIDAGHEALTFEKARAPVGATT